MYLTGTQTFTFTPVDPMSAPSKAQKVRTPKLTVEDAFAPVTNRHGRFFWACGGAAGHRPRVQRVAVRPLYMRLNVRHTTATQPLLQKRRLRDDQGGLPSQAFHMTRLFSIGTIKDGPRSFGT